MGKTTPPSQFCSCIKWLRGYEATHWERPPLPLSFVAAYSCGYAATQWGRPLLPLSFVAAYSSGYAVGKTTPPPQFCSCTKWLRGYTVTNTEVVKKKPMIGRTRQKTKENFPGKAAARNLEWTSITCAVPLLLSYTLFYVSWQKSVRTDISKSSCRWLLSLNKRSLSFRHVCQSPNPSPLDPSPTPPHTSIYQKTNMVRSAFCKLHPPSPECTRTHILRPLKFLCL